MDLREIAAAYQSIYLKEEVEDNILLEDLSQDEVDDLVEEIIDELLEEGFSLEQIEEGFEDYISEESEVLNEARRARRRSGGKSYEEVRAEIDAREAEKKKKKEASSSAAASAARAAKVEADKAEKVVRPSEKIAASAKKVVAKRKDATGTTSGTGTEGTVRSKGGSMGAEGKKGTALPPAKKGGAIVKRNEPIGPKVEIKKGVKKAMTYRMSKADLKRANRRDDTSAAPKSKTDRVKDAASAVRVGARNLKKKAGKALGKLAAKLSEEGGELDSFDTVIAYLIDEEIASDFTEANVMMTKLSAETISEIHESQMTYITEISAQLAHTASMKADEVRRKASLAGDRETAAKKSAQASRLYKGVGPRRAKERKENT